MVRKYVQAARDAGVLDWIFLAVGILMIGLSVAYADLRPGTGGRSMPEGGLQTGEIQDGLKLHATRPH